MPEPIDSSERNPVKKESKNEKAIRMWKPLLLAQAEGTPLTLEQQRALELRSTCLSLVDALNPLIEDSSVKDKPEEEAGLVVKYHEALTKLKEMGIEPDMKTEQPEEFYYDPLNAVEWIAGQLIDIHADELLSTRQVKHQINEHSEFSTSFDKNTIDVVSNKNNSSKYMEWTHARAILAFSNVFLAAGLNKLA